MAFSNRPSLHNESGEPTIKRYVHSPLTVEHNGINATITENGRVILSEVSKVVGDEVEYDELEIPASLIFKLAGLLKATRKVKYVTFSELAAAKATSHEENEN